VAAIGSGYFRTLGATMRDGREFDDFDDASSAAVAVVNERFATASWPGTEPIGQRFRVFDGSTPGPWLTVVGVVSNIRSSPSRGEQGFEPRVYVPYRQRPGTAAWVYVRSRLPIGSLTPALRREVQNVDPDLPIWLGPFKLDERLAGSGAYWSIASHTALFLLFAAIALLLAASGLYAVIAHSVGQRTQEIGVRLAVGGTARDIFGLVLRQGLAPLGLGLAIGLVLSVALTRVLRSELVGVSPADPVALGTACLVLMAAALLGCLIPARRAMRVDPVVALRHE
jgi:putative ABC transport system permease protein